MDKVEEILPRITEFIKFELAKESLSPLAERTRLYYVERIEAVLEQNGDRCNGHAEKQASTSFLSTASTFHDSTSLASTVPQPESQTSSSSDVAEAQSVPVAATDAISPAASGCESWSGRRTSVIHGNVVTNPFRKPSVDTLTDKRTNFEFHNNNFHSMEGAYETLPCDQNDSYQVFNNSDDNMKCYSSNVDISGVNGETSDFNDTDFENSEDEMPATYTAKTPSGNHFVSMPSLSSLLTSNKSSKNADLSNRTFGGELHQKGVLGQYTKRFCAISGSDFVCCKSEKEPKLVLMFPLSNCHVLLQEKDGKLGHELKFVVPNLPNYMFYTENKEAALLWMQEITKVRRELNGEAGKFPTEEPMSGSTDDTDLQSVSTLSSENISGGSYEKAMAQKADSDTSSDNKKKSKIQTFLGTFGRKRGNKLKLLAATSDENTISQDALIGGYVKVYCEVTTNKKWLKRFCTVQGGNLYCKRDMMEERPELVFPLPGAEMSLAEKESKKELTIKLVRKDMELCLEIADSSEHGQWVQVLLNETGFANQLNRNSKGLNTINVAGQDSNIDSRKNNVPRLPSSSPPITPPVGREVRDKHSEPIYIEPLSPTSPDSFDFTDDSFAPDCEPAGESIYMNLCTLTGEPLTNDFSAISDPANNNNPATNARTNKPAQPANGVPNASSGKGRVENVHGGTTPLSSHKNETQSTGKVPIPKKPTNVTITKSLEKLSGGSNDQNRNKISKVNSHPIDVKPSLQVKPTTGRLSDVGLKPEMGLKGDNARWCSDLSFVADRNNSESSDTTWTVSNAVSVEYTKPFKASLGISKSTESSITSGVESRPIKFSPAPSNHDTVSDSIESAPVLNNNKPASNKTSIVMERVKLFETTSQAATS